MKHQSSWTAHRVWVQFRRYQLALVPALLILLLFSGTALAAEVAGGDTYVLPRGEVIADDFYVSGGEVVIDGTVEGDLVVAGGYVEINGVVMGDLIAAGGAVVVTGVVQDDVRAAGGAIVVSGNVGDDLFAAGGGSGPGMPAIPMQLGSRSVVQGLEITNNARIGGDVYIAGGQGRINGAIGGDLLAGMGALSFAGSVAGDANLQVQSLAVSENARVQGTLRYDSDENTVIPEAVAARVVQDEPQETGDARRNPLAGFFGWILRTLLLILGLGLLGWIVWSFARRRVTDPVASLDQRPMEAGIYGLLVAVAVLPLSFALVFLAVLFWGWFPGGLVMLAFLFGIFGLLWLFSPVITGLWIGRKIVAAMGNQAGQGDLAALLLGIAAIVIVGRLLALVPFVGELAFRAIYLISFALAVGGTILAGRRAATGAVRVYPSEAPSA